MAARPAVALAPVGILGGLVAGILLGERAGPASARGVLLLGVVLGAVALRRRGRLAVTVGVLAAALVGVAITQRALHGLVESSLAPLVERRAEVVAHGSLVADPEGMRFGTTRVLVRVARVEVDGAPRSVDRVVLATADADAGDRLRVLEAGDRVEVVGWLSPLRGWDVRRRYDHAVARLAVTDLVGFAAPAEPLLRIANHVRAVVVRGSAALPPGDAALLRGYILGDTRGISPEVEARYRAAGMSHLLAVSGANLALVLVVLAPVRRHLGLTGRLVTGLVAVAVFGAMTRWEPSVLRASAMIACVLVADYLGRPAAAARALTLAAGGLLLVDPFLLHSVGFLLSCGASAGLVVLARPLAARLPGPGWVRHGLGATIGAQIGVAPVLLPVFGSVPLVSLPANLVAVPLAAMLMVAGLVASVVGGLVPPVAGIAQLPCLGLVRFQAAVATAAARAPLALDGRAAWGVVAVVLGLAAGQRARRALAGSVATDASVPSR